MEVCPYSYFQQFLCEGLPSFNPKRFCYPYAWSCSLCERRNSFCMGLISRKLCGFLFLSSFTSLSVLLLFPLSITFFVIMHSLFYFIFHGWGSKINWSANVFVFEDFKGLVLQKYTVWYKIFVKKYEINIFWLLKKHISVFLNVFYCLQKYLFLKLIFMMSLWHHICFVVFLKNKN